MPTIKWKLNHIKRSALPNIIFYIERLGKNIRIYRRARLKERVEIIANLATGRKEDRKLLYWDREYYLILYSGTISKVHKEIFGY